MQFLVSRSEKTKCSILGMVIQLESDGIQWSSLSEKNVKHSLVQQENYMRFGFLNNNIRGILKLQNKDH